MAGVNQVGESRAGENQARENQARAGEDPFARAGVNPLAGGEAR